MCHCRSASVMSSAAKQATLGEVLPGPEIAADALSAGPIGKSDSYRVSLSLQSGRLHSVTTIMMDLLD